MDEEEQLPNDLNGSEEIPPQRNMAAGVLACVVVIAAGAIAIYTGIAQTAAGLMVFPGIPLVLLWFVWRVFLRRLWRMRSIRNAQEKRELMEAALRKKSIPDKRE